MTGPGVPAWGVGLGTARVAVLKSRCSGCEAGHASYLVVLGALRALTRFACWSATSFRTGGNH